MDGAKPRSSYVVDPARSSAGGGSFSTKRSNTTRNVKSKEKLPIRQIVHIIRRLVILATAIVYIYRSIDAGVHSLLLMRGAIEVALGVPYISPLIPHYVGTTTIRASPLVKDVLGDTTTPRNDTIYLVSDTEVSFESCTGSSTFNPGIYLNEEIRKEWKHFVQETSYNLTFLTNNELIAPVIDCNSDSIVWADDSTKRVFYLMRKKTDPDNVYILTMSYSTQDYVLPEEHQVGATASIVLTLINDVRASSVDYYFVQRLGFPFQLGDFRVYEFVGVNDESFWELDLIPSNPEEETNRRVQTACRTGFYVNAETEQCNVKNLNWDLSQDPIETMRSWPWSGNVTLRDSWAWVHCIHFLFAADTLFNLLVLMMVVYRNMRQGKFWVGDAFVSVSNTIILRGALVLLTWYINGFWTLMEYCLKESNQINGTQLIVAYPSVIHADLLTVFLSLSGILGFLLRERIDPALAVILFEIGFANRQPLAHWFSQTKAAAVAYANFDYLENLIYVSPKYTDLTAMRLWSMHPLPYKDTAFIFASLFPVFIPFVVVIVYVPLRKIYRRFVPEQKITMSRVTGTSTEGEALLSWKGSLTIFEVATGAPLQNRVGLVSDYDNCIYIKGMKYASADGIYCNGYVVANGKYLISTEDLFAILVMVLLRIRFKNVYVYEVNSHTVQQTARLVYPQTMTLKDLLNLNISVLS